MGRSKSGILVRCELKIAPPWPKLMPAVACLPGALGLLSEKTNAHSLWIQSVAFSPDGTKVVSGSRDKTIKVWGSGAARAQNRPSLAKTDAFWRVWQANWSY